MKIIAITNQKGGVGKTTTATALAAGLQMQGFRTLLVDTDPQGNASDTYGLDEDRPTVYDVFTGAVTAQEAIQHTAQGDLLPGDIQMSAADMTFTRQGREFILREALSPIAAQYDYLILDTPPALGVTTINALTAADSLIVPVLADRYSLKGINQLTDTIETVQKYSNPRLRIEGILLTRYNARMILSRDVRFTIEQMAESWNTKVFKTTIRQSVTIPESQTQQESIFHYAPDSTTGQDYAAFIEEFLKGERKDGKERF